MPFQRTQVYLRPEQHASLKDEAHRLSISLAELLRRIVAEHLDRKAVASRPDLSAIVGLGDSGIRDGSLHHDQYLAEPHAPKNPR